MEIEDALKFGKDERIREVTAYLYVSVYLITIFLMSNESKNGIPFAAATFELSRAENVRKC